jgi:hypothetical protein
LEAPVAAAAAAAGFATVVFGTGGFEAFGGGGGREGRDDFAYVRAMGEKAGRAARRATLVNMLAVALRK